MYASARSAATRSSGSSNVGRVGHGARDGHDHPGIRPPGDLGHELGDVDPTCVSYVGVGVRRRASASRRARAPTPRPAVRAGRPSRYANVVSSGAIIPARAPHSMDMLQIVIRSSIESARIASPAYSTTCPTPPSTPSRPIAPRIMSFAVSPGGSSPANSTQHRPRPALGQRLRREHVLDLGRADPERERAEGAVRGRVAVAADDRHARLRQAELGPDHVDDPLAARARWRGARSPNSSQFARSASSCALRQRVGRPGPAASARCGPSSRPSARAGAPCGRRAAAPRRPAPRSPRGRGAGRRRAASARPAPRGRRGGPRPSRRASCPRPAQAEPSSTPVEERVRVRRRSRSGRT